MIAGIYCVVMVLAAIFVYAAVGTNPGMVAAMIAAPLAILAAAHFIVGSSADGCKGRTASLVLGAVTMLVVPIGTVMGIYIVKYSLGEWVPEKRLSESLADGWPQSQQEAA
ncbi:hypothetical protein MNR01_11715 [Lysobacter sp. S4-A87]|uniref:hypothetical protein n=1 Tax=Lysobacter sp. S4-A87 TaxID=2925843 RepID=UPI001F53BBD3|nr:hypothetical protein [Lysobacter sp. S4-A87]UNK48432.1 hypothetical protein MNR01_11715 [Lysobacter sp. S4-A87]